MQLRDDTNTGSKFEELSEQFLEELRQGQDPSAETYAKKHPEWADEIRDLFPTIKTMEQAKQRKKFGTTASSGGVLLGGRVIERLGDFRILRELGRGGMGVVYEAEQKSLGRRVALKVLRDNILAESTQAKRFKIEARAAARLHHTNIVPVFGVGEQDNVHYYVMQRIVGEGLDSVLTSLQRLDSAVTEAVASPEDSTDAPLENTQADSFARALVKGTFWVPKPEHRRSDSSASIAAEQIAVAQTALLTNEQLANPTAGDDGVFEEAASNDGPANFQAAAKFRGRDYWRSVARIGHDVADALSYAHTQGTLHRDIKPGNLILDVHGVVWVTDFGLAKLAELGDVTRTGDIVGTLRYMAPEQFDGKCDPRSDIYSLGLTLYELLVLRPAYDQTDGPRLIQQISQDRLPSPRALNSSIPRDLDTIVQKATSHDPAHRYQTASDLADDLERFMRDKPIRARRVKPVERFWRWCRRNPAMASASAAVVVLLMLVAVVASVGYLKTSEALTGEEQQRRRAQQQQRLAEENAATAEEQRRLAQENLEQANIERGRAEDNLEKAENERRRAETTLELALRALDQVFTHVAPPALPRYENVSIDDERFEPEAFASISEDDVKLLRSMLKFYDRFSQQHITNAHLQSQAAEAHRRMGDIYQRLGQFRRASDSYSLAMAIYEPLVVRLPIDDDAWTAIAATYNELGQMQKLNGNPSDAQQLHKQALSILKRQLLELPNSTSVNLELVRTYNYLGFAMRDRLERDESLNATAASEVENNQRSALDVLEQLLLHDPVNPELRLMMARSYRDLAPTLLWRGRLKEAVRAQERAIETLEELSEQYPDVPQHRYELISVLLRWDERLWGQDKDHEGERRYRRALELAEDLVRDYPDVAEYSARLAFAHFKLGMLMRQVGEFENAESELQTASDQLERQVGQYPETALYQLYLAMARNAMAELMQDDSRHEQAKQILQLSVEEAAQLPSELKSRMNRFFGKRLLVQQYTNLGQSLMALGEDKAAKEAFAKAQKIRLRR